MDKSFCSNIHNWDFNCPVRSDFDGFDSVDVVGSDVGLLEETSQLVIEIEPVVGISGLELGELAFPERGSSGEVSCQGFEAS